MDDLKTEVRQDLDNLKTDVSQRFTDTHKRLDNLHAEMNQRFDQVNRELAENRERMAKLEGPLEASSPGAATATQRNARAQHRPSRNTAPGRLTILYRTIHGKSRDSQLPFRFRHPSQFIVLGPFLLRQQDQTSALSKLPVKPLLQVRNLRLNFVSRPRTPGTPRGIHLIQGRPRIQIRLGRVENALDPI